MRVGLIVWLALAVWSLGQSLSEEVQGRKTVLGCYLRGWHGIEDGRCDAPAPTTGDTHE